MSINDKGVGSTSVNFNAEAAAPAPPVPPNVCMKCSSQMREIRLCLNCKTAHALELPSNRGCTIDLCPDLWHFENASAPAPVLTQPSAPEGNEPTIEWWQKQYNNLLEYTKTVRGCPHCKCSCEMCAPCGEEENRP